MRRNRVPLVYWDSNVFIRNLKSKPPPPLEVETIIDLAQCEQIHLVSSSISHVELLEQDNPRFLDAYVTFYLFSQPYIDLLALEASEGDRWEIVKLARRMRVHFAQDNEGRPTEKTVGVADSIHLATALVCGVDAFHTFDRKDKKVDKENCELGLLGLDGKIMLARIVALLICDPQIYQGDVASGLFHRPGCKKFSRAYLYREVRPRTFRRKHPLFLAQNEALACHFVPCESCCEQKGHASKA